MVSFLFLIKDDEFKDIRPCIYFINFTLISLFLGAIFLLSDYRSSYFLVGLILIALFYTAFVGNFILLLMKLIIRSEDKYHKLTAREAMLLEDTIEIVFEPLVVPEIASTEPINITEEQLKIESKPVTKKKTQDKKKTTVNTNQKKKTTPKKKSTTKKKTTVGNKKVATSTTKKSSSKKKVSTNKKSTSKNKKKNQSGRSK